MKLAEIPAMIARELGVRPQQTAAVIELLDGATPSRLSPATAKKPPATLMRNKSVPLTNECNTSATSANVRRKFVPQSNPRAN